VARIVVDARTIASSTGRYAERLLEHLQEVDGENECLVLIRPADIDYWRPSAKNFSLVEAPFADFSWGEQWGLNKLLKGLSPDLVHFTMPQYPLLYRGRFVSTIHDTTMLDYDHGKWYDLHYAFRRAVFKQVFKSAVRRSAHLIVPTNYVRRRLRERFAVPGNKITVTHEAADRLGVRSRGSGVRRGKSSSKLLASSSSKFLLYVGQATPYKNLGRLIDAFALLSPNYPALSLVIVGKETRWHKGLRAQAEAAGFGDRVIFTGFVPDAELVRYYEAAEAYVFPSLSEGFGLPGLEAMLYGCPVLAAGNGCLPEVYGDDALYFDPISVEDMATVINRVLSDRTERRKLAAAGKAKAGEYSWRRLAQQTHAVYESALRTES
jgi:glycosyltransferase involved in cell wall biosynthesis